jgi:iron complex outermembrane receptor protein
MSISRANLLCVTARTLSSAAFVFISCDVSAQTSSTETVLPPVVVTASRFANDPSSNPIGATVITAEQIREAGAGSVNEAIRKIGGVYGRQNFSGTQDFQLDLRGFGTTSDQNLVILVDGIRLSENELSTALLSSIPIESVERIEIVRGGSSVLYGEGATGGTIQIITKRPISNTFSGTVMAEAGNYGHQELRTSVAKAWDGFALDAHASKQRADNYRDNNAVTQDNFSGGGQWSSKEGRVGARVDLARQTSRFPGALTLAQFQANPRQTNTPNDFGSTDVNSYTVFGERNLGAFDVAADLSQRDKTSKAVFVSAFGTFDSRADTRVTQFSPRIRHLSGSGNVNNEFVTGLDFFRWTRATKSNFGGFPSSDAKAFQKSKALYARDEIRIKDTRVALGARHEVFDKDFTDPLGFGTTAYTQTHSLNAWDLQGSHAVSPNFSLFAKAGQSYRVANVDENAATPTANQPLAPQTSHDLELGSSLGNAAQKATLRVFQHRLKNEIFYDPTLFANRNLEPTKREGVELEANTKIASAYSLSVNLQHVNAKFTDGPNAGKEMVLVPPNTAALRLNWLPGTKHSANVGLLWVDSQRYGGDFSNTCSARMPSYTTLDGRYALHTGAWEFAISGTNLTDKNYFTSAFGACQNGIYPDMGRQIKVSARLNF